MRRILIVICFLISCRSTTSEYTPILGYWVNVESLSSIYEIKKIEINTNKSINFEISNKESNTALNFNGEILQYLEKTPVFSKEDGYLFGKIVVKLKDKYWHIAWTTHESFLTLEIFENHNPKNILGSSVLGIFRMKKVD